MNEQNKDQEVTSVALCGCQITFRQVYLSIPAVIPEDFCYNTFVGTFNMTDRAAGELSN